MTSKILRNYLPEIFALGFIRSKPSMVTVNISSRCNQRCIYCEIGCSIPSPGKDRLTPDDLQWIIDQMALTGIRKISLCGGEPFLFEGLIDVISYAGKYNIWCSVTTNGMTAYKLNHDDLEILKSCRTEINISLDSFREEIQAMTRGIEGSIPEIMKSIQKLSEFGIPVTVLTVISKYNYHNLFHFLRTAFEQGIRQVLFQPVIYYSNYPDRCPVENKSELNAGVENLDFLMEELKKILRFERTHDIKTNVYRLIPWIREYLTTAEKQDGTWFFNKVLKKFYCREIDAIVDITYDGGIQPCGLALATINIHENRQQGLLTLWSQATEGIRDDMKNGRYRKYCNGCCHHFSRNMLASLMKYPVRNRMAFVSMLQRILSRILSHAMKRITL